ncbi:hypothetical protein [Shigella sonnei]|nr:hypothetical protein [Shigella sonnei]
MFSKLALSSIKAMF